MWVSSEEINRICIELEIQLISFQSSLEDEWKWQKLEEIVVQFASPKPIMIFKPLRALFTSQMPTSESPLSVHGGNFRNWFHWVHWINSLEMLLFKLRTNWNQFRPGEHNQTGNNLRRYQFTVDFHQRKWWNIHEREPVQIWCEQWWPKHDLQRRCFDIHQSHSIERAWEESGCHQIDAALHWTIDHQRGGREDFGQCNISEMMK